MFIFEFAVERACPCAVQLKRIVTDSPLPAQPAVTLQARDSSTLALLASSSLVLDYVTSRSSTQIRFSQAQNLTFTVVVDSQGPVLNSPQNITILPAPVDQDLSTFSVRGTSLISGQSLSAYAQARDVYGNLLTAGGDLVQYVPSHSNCTMVLAIGTLAIGTWKYACT
jgi:hypothetical protein